MKSLAPFWTELWYVKNKEEEEEEEEEEFEKNLKIPRLIFTINTSDLFNFNIATVWFLRHHSIMARQDTSKGGFRRPGNKS